MFRTESFFVSVRVAAWRFLNFHLFTRYFNKCCHQPYGNLDKTSSIYFARFATRWFYYSVHSAIITMDCSKSHNKSNRLPSKNCPDFKAIPDNTAGHTFADRPRARPSVQDARHSKVGASFQIKLFRSRFVLVFNFRVGTRKAGTAKESEKERKVFKLKRLPGNN